MDSSATQAKCNTTDYPEQSYLRGADYYEQFNQAETEIPETE